MTDQWRRTTGSAVQPGDRVRVSDDELTVTRIESPFMGMAGMIAFIEDSPERWIKRPVQADSEVEVLGTSNRGGARQTPVSRGPWSS